MRFNGSRSLRLGAGLLALISFAGCGGSGSAPTSTSTSHTYVGTQSPGDVWNWTVGSSTFTVSNLTKGTSYSGTSSVLPSGFYKLTVSSSTDPTAPVASVAYAFDVPGVALIAQPAGSITRPVVGAAVGTNPANTSNYNWIAIPRTHWNAATDEAYGTATITMTDSNNGTVAIVSDAINGTVLGTHSQGVSWANGEFTSNGTGVVTPAGIIMVDNGPGQGGVFGVQTPTSKVDLADLAAQEYRGILFKGGASGSVTELVQCTPDSSGGLNGAGYIDVEHNGIDPDPTHHVTLRFTGQPSPGLVTGVLTEASGNQSFVFAINKVGGKYMIYGFAKEEDGTPDNFLLIQKGS